ncbi:MAG: transaldolase [Chloroflexota bacterium]
MNENPLLQLHTFGQDIWLDVIHRRMLRDGELRRLIAEDGLRGVTTNPSIFEKAICGSHDYDDAIRALVAQGQDARQVYQALTVADVQEAADQFRPLFEREPVAGFVSLEVSPHLAYDTAATIAEARVLWAAANRPNVMIKVPGTQEGLAAIRTLIGEGVNVNVTLLFGLPRYREVAQAYLAGVRDALAQGRPVAGVASVASFFLSRIDTLVDPLLEEVERGGGARGELAGQLCGQVAIASARIAYQMFRELFGGAEFAQLAGQGARPQRPLWASTSTKNPAYGDLKYVEALIGPQTINTLPPETLVAYRDHGRPQASLERDLDEARAVLARLPEVGVDLDQATSQLEREGAQKFVASYDTLLAALEERCTAALR